MLDSVRELYESGQLKSLVETGIVQKHIFIWVQIFIAYENEYKKTGSKMQAMENVAFEFQITVDMISKIRKKLSAENQPV